MAEKGSETGNFSRYFVEFLRRPVGWFAAIVLVFAGALILVLTDTLFFDADPVRARLFGEALGIALFAAYVFPLTRILLRDKLDLRAPRWWLWIVAAVAERVAIEAAIFGISVFGFIAFTEFMTSWGGQWRHIILDAVLSPLLVGLYVWKIGLVCGSSSARLADVNRFIWQKRKAVFLAYFVIAIVDLTATIGSSLWVNAIGEMGWQIVYLVTGGITTWLIGMLLIAAYLDFVLSRTSIRNVFE